MQANAHAPYSRFPVGAAVRAGVGSRVRRRATSRTRPSPKASAPRPRRSARWSPPASGRSSRRSPSPTVTTLVTCCGGCRQRIREFAGPDVLVHAAGPDGVRRTFTVGRAAPGVVHRRPTAGLTSARAACGSMRGVPSTSRRGMLARVPRRRTVGAADAGRRRVAGRRRGRVADRRRPGLRVRPPAVPGGCRGGTRAADRRLGDDDHRHGPGVQPHRRRPADLLDAVLAAPAAQLPALPRHADRPQHLRQHVRVRHRRAVHRRPSPGRHAVRAARWRSARPSCWRSGAWPRFVWYLHHLAHSIQIDDVMRRTRAGDPRRHRAGPAPTGTNVLSPTHRRTPLP